MMSLTQSVSLFLRDLKKGNRTKDVSIRQQVCVFPPVFHVSVNLAVNFDLVSLGCSAQYPVGHSQHHASGRQCYAAAACVIYHPLLHRSESRFPSFNAWLLDGRIQIESNLPLVTYSADYLIHIVLQDSKPNHIFKKKF